jgi:hypothetical protein
MYSAKTSRLRDGSERLALAVDSPLGLTKADSARNFDPSTISLNQFTKSEMQSFNHR